LSVKPIRTPRVVLLVALACAGALAQVPRPEYPQPQFEREQWMSLNGPWEFEFDDAHAGIAENWAAGSRKFTRTITVPFAFETKLSGIGETAFHPEVWYRRKFTVPAGWRGRRVLLHFGAVNYRARVWLNGQALGEHEGGNVPFAFDVTPVAKVGAANVLVVRSEFPSTDRYIPRGKQYWEPKPRSIFYNRTSGIWQPVWLESAGPSYLARVRITPSQDGTVRFAAQVANAANDLTFRVTASFGGGTIATTEVPAVAEHTAAALGVTNPQSWSPDNPHLYDVIFELRRGAEVLDRVKSYFGFRTVEAKNGRVYLNGHPIYLKLLLDQGYWPDSNLTPPSDEALQYDIRLSKEMGFNGVRKHQKVADPRFLYWADRMGFLVSGEIANAYEYDEHYVQRILREWTDAVERDYNHPSIIVWNMINESWGVPDLARDPRQVAHLRSSYLVTKSLDSTRLMIDNEGWQHTDMTDLFAVHDYARNGDLLYSRWKDAPKSMPRVGPSTLIAGFEYNGSPLYLSEFGGVAFIPPGHQVPAESWGYSGVEKTEADALARLTSLWSAIAKLPFAGICYTQITDVEQEINGLMTYDRKPKFDVKKIKALNDLLQ
jgi:beta-galactosidase/beta-glucuronidase